MIRSKASSLFSKLGAKPPSSPTDVARPTENKSKLGANAMLAVSLAVANCAANYLDIPLYVTSTWIVGNPLESNTCLAYISLIYGIITKMCFSSTWNRFSNDSLWQYGK